MKKIDSEADLTLSGHCVIKFFTNGCVPCKKLDVILNKMVEEFKSIPVYAIDIEKMPKLAQKYRIMSVPTLLFLKKEKEARERIVGLSPTEEVRKAFKELDKLFEKDSRK